MRFNILKSNLNILNLMRELGYKPHGPENYSRPLSGLPYPRFHIYIQEQNNNFVFNLHLDQKKPSYSGQTAHSGEYDSELVIQESKRIQQIIQRC